MTELGSGLGFVQANDQHGRKDGDLWLDGAHVARVAFGTWPDHLVIYEVEPLPHAPADLDRRLAEALMAGYPDGVPPRITHASVRSVDTLRWYRDAARTCGTVVCGSVYDKTLYYDPITVLSDEDLVEREVEPDTWGVWASVMVDAAFDDMDDLCALPTARVAARWWSKDLMWRIAALRRLAMDPRADASRVDDLHHVGLLDAQSAARQFSSMHLSGFYPGIAYTPDVHRMIDAMNDPLAILDRYGPAPELNADQARQNARYALLFSLGNLMWTASSAGAPAWMRDAPAVIGAALDRQLAAFTADRDRWVYGLALAEVTHGRFAAGTSAPLTLLDATRFAVHRYRLLCRMGQRAFDRFYWLIFATEALCSSTMNPSRMTGPDDRPLARALYGPSPRTPTPPRRPLPPHLVGEHLMAETWPVEPEVPPI